MATLVIRDLDDEVVSRRRVQAAENGRSLEEEASAILAQGVVVRRLRAVIVLEDVLPPRVA